MMNFSELMRMDRRVEKRTSVLWGRETKKDESLKWAIHTQKGCMSFR